MKKYFLFFKLAILDEFQYRANFLVRIFSKFIPIIGIYYLWAALYFNGAQYGQYNLSHLTSYFLIVTLINLLIPSFSVISTLGDEVRTGLLSTHLLRPANYKLAKFFYFLGERLIYLFVCLLITALLMVLFGKTLAFPQSLFVWIAFILSVIQAIALSFWLFISFSIGAFWFTRIIGFAFVLESLAGFLRGDFIPLDLLPLSFQLMLNLLPFKYLVFFPAQIFLSQLSLQQTLVGLVLQLMWITISIFVSQPIWKLGLNKYESVGS